MSFITKVTARDFLLSGCMYAADIDLEYYIYALQVGLVLDVNNISIPRAAGIL